jgi:molecular chaperone HscB
VQPLDDACTFFSLFGMERAVDIDGGELEKRFKDLQRGLHPDKFAYRQQQQQQQQQQQGSGSSGDEELDEVALSAAASARVNKAYQTLRRPLDRVKYVLEQEGITVLSESGGGTREATGGTGGTGGGGSSNASNASNAAFATSPALLMEVMELREEVEDFRAAKDADALKAMASSATARVDHCMAAITAWHAGHRARVGGVGGEVDPSSSSDAALDEIANEAVRLQYYSKIQEEIDTALEAVQ